MLFWLVDGCFTSLMAADDCCTGRGLDVELLFEIVAVVVVVVFCLAACFALSSLYLSQSARFCSGVALRQSLIRCAPPQ